MKAFTFAPAISTSRSPKSICSCRPGGVSNRIVANASAFKACRYGCKVALHRARTDRDALLGEQFLAHHVGVAAMADEPLAQPIVEPVELLRPHRRA